MPNFELTMRIAPSRLFFHASFLALALISLAFRPPQTQIQKISAHMKSRTLAGGKFFTIEADFYYKNNGDMVAYFNPPLEYIITTNRKGMSRVYNPKDNTVGTHDDPFLGSNTSYFNCFLNRKMADMGLRDFEFQMSGSRYEKPYSVSVWVPGGLTQKAVSKVELAHQDGMIAYAGYYSPKGKLFKKVFYGKGKTVMGTWLPESITSITYVSDKDSIVEKTEYSNFKVNEQANSTWFDFLIPADAKPIDIGQ